MGYSFFKMTWTLKIVTKIKIIHYDQVKFDVYPVKIK